MAFHRKSRETVDDICRLGQGICKWCEKFLVPVIIGSGPRESKYNLTVGRLVIHQFWRRAQDTHIHTQRHTAVCAGLRKHRKMLCQTLTLLADAPTTGHPPVRAPISLHLAKGNRAHILPGMLRESSPRNSPAASHYGKVTALNQISVCFSSRWKCDNEVECPLWTSKAAPEISVIRWHKLVWAIYVSRATSATPETESLQRCSTPKREWEGSTSGPQLKSAMTQCF